MPQHLREFSFNDVKTVTDNFAELLGKGGFGPVYKGQLQPSNSTEKPTIDHVAVKRLDVSLGQGERQFKKEIFTLATYTHPNLVSLLGFCEEGDEKILVYKYEVNKSLDRYLDSSTLTWEQRLNICLGVARGLAYLHDGEGEAAAVIHRDIKSSNILLDEKWEAKISDLGLSKICPKDESSTKNTAPCGTVGYLDPIYMNTGVLTKESDVYSFGVVIFEVLCGKRAFMTPTPSEHKKLLSSWVKSHYHKDNFNEICIMPHLREHMKQYSSTIFSKLAFRCLNEDRECRPSIVSVIKVLENILKQPVVTQIAESISYTGQQTRLWGSKTGGDPFWFQLKSNQKLRKITIYYNRWIHSLIFTTQDSDGSWQQPLQYGGLGYNPNTTGVMYEIDFDGGEEIVGLSGTVGKHNGFDLISSLSFITNEMNYGPFGEVAHAHFSRSWKVGQFDGFHGRGGWYIDALGCLLKDKYHLTRSI